MAGRGDEATQYQYDEALRDAIEWASDLDAPITRDDATFAEVESHAFEADGAAARDRAVTDRLTS